MKKTFLLSLLLTLLGTVSAWAEFNPEAGKMYALKEKTTGLYLDIQTLGINEANANATTNNISLNTNPCIIYLEKGTTDNAKWALKNANGTYAMQASSRDWNVVIGSTPYEWSINEPETGLFTIARADGKFISMDNATPGSPLFCDKGTGLKFSLVEYSGLNQHYATLKSPTGTYLSLTTSGNTAASFQTEEEYFYIMPSADKFYLESKTKTGKYIGSTHSWNTTTDFSLWMISNVDEDGRVLISRASGTGDIYLGSNTNSNNGTGIYTNVPSNCNRWQVSEFIDCPTDATSKDGKYHFTSERLWYMAPCNKLRFILTESGAYYKNGKKRMSFDSFELFDASDKKVELKDSHFSGNNNGKTFANMLDGANGTYCAGTWADGTEDDYFEIDLPEEIDFGGAFSFSFVTENTTMNAKAFRIEVMYEKREAVDYTFAVNAPEGKDYTVSYDGEPVEAGAVFKEDEFDTELFSATEIPGYTWSIVVDDENYTITLLYTEAPSVENPDAVVALVNRIGGAGTDGKFKFVLDPSLNSKQEAFVIGGEGGKIQIKGTTISAITTGLGWYLNNIAKINIAWNSLNEKTVSGDAYADLSNIPVPTAEETHTCDAKYRYYLNYCTFGYSMTSWTWKRWQQEIDWMALHGINMPLQIVGLEEVWRQFLTMEQGGKRKYGYTDEEAKAFVAGPAFTAWWGMNNLEGWGGTATGSKSGYDNLAGAGGVQDDAWYVRQKALAQKIVTLQRELGMQPVLPGWSGMVPSNFQKESGFITRSNGGNWAGDFVRPLLLSVSNANYAEIAADYYTCLKDVMGESQYYSMDPFHEGGGAGTMEDYKALYDAMEIAKEGSQWVIQQWQWSATQAYSLTAVPAGRLVVLDLFSDGSPAFDSYNGYAPQDAVFCAIPNFGGRSGLMGRLNNVTDNYFAYKTKYASIKGIGTAPEAIEQTPVTYELIYQLPWMGSKPSVAEWIKNYATARYGTDNTILQEAWELLRQGPLNYGADAIQGPVEDVWAARPNLDANKASSWGKTLKDAANIYTPARRQMLIDATYKLLSQKNEIGDDEVFQSNYNYDLVEFGGAVMADYAYDLLLAIKAAKNTAGNNFANDATYKARRNAFLALIEDVDKFKGTNLNFRLGKWTQEARDAAGEVTGATTATPDWYEYNNARTILTTWSSPGTNLTDYSYRSWQGLMKDVYLPRWKYYFNNNCNGGEYKFFEWNWAHGMEHAVGQTAISTTPLEKGQAGHTDSYTREPEGNTVEEAQKLLAKYIIPVTMSDGVHYAYRFVVNDLSTKVTIVAQAGGTIDLTQYFGELGDAAIAGDFIDGNVTDLGKVAIKADAADGGHTGTITLSDGTVLTFAVVLNPAYYGVYNINYKDGSNAAPVFVAYNEDKDNSNNKGYKLIATGKYQADAEADKMFTIVPNGTGYSLSAQGKFLKSPTLGAWNHLMFSDDASEAGSYIIEETDTKDVFKIRSTGEGINYINDYDNFVFGNDKSNKENLSTFTISEVNTYAMNITDAGMATLCLPFNVILPEGMLAYDLSVENIASAGAEGKYTATMKVVAKAGETLKKGTPVIVEATPGIYNLNISMSDNGAKVSLAGSLLRGNFVKQNLVQGSVTKKYIFANGTNGIGFYLMNESGTIGANKCWMEWTVPAGQAEARSFIISFDNATGISDIITVTKESRIDLIYNIGGQRLNKPQKGLNIIGKKKVIIK